MAHFHDGAHVGGHGRDGDGAGLAGLGVDPGGEGGDEGADAEGLGRGRREDGGVQGRVGSLVAEGRERGIVRERAVTEQVCKKCECRKTDKDFFRTKSQVMLTLIKVETGEGKNRVHTTNREYFFRTN